MKKKRLEFIKLSVTLILFIVFSTQFSKGQKIEKLDTTFVKSSALSSNEVVRLNASGYDVRIKTWKKNEVKIEYRFFIEASERAEILEFYGLLEDLLDKQLSSLNEEINVSVPITSMISTNNRTVIQFKGMSKKYKLKKFKRELIVYTSETNALQIKSSFNKLSIEDIRADVSVDISSAHFTMGDCKKLDLKASFSKDMKIGALDNASFVLSSSSLTMGKITNDIDLKASFSTIAIEDIGGNADMEMNSSSFTTNSIKELNLHGSFVRSFKVNKVKNAYLSTNSSKLDIMELKNVEIEKASFSDFELHSLSGISIGETNSSTFKIGKIVNFNVKKASFSHISIAELSGSFVAKANSGNITIDKIENGFGKVQIDGQFVDIDIKTTEDCQFKFQAKFTFPHYSFNDLYFKKQEMNTNVEMISGHKGEFTNSSSLILLSCESCDVKLE